MKNKIKQAVIDIIKYANDTYWIGPGETVAERLCEIADLDFEKISDEIMNEKRCVYERQGLNKAISTASDKI